MLMTDFPEGQNIQRAFQIAPSTSEVEAVIRPEYVPSGMEMGSACRRTQTWCWRDCRDFCYR